MRQLKINMESEKLKNLIEAVNKRDKIAVESFKYMQNKTKYLSF